MSDQNMKIIIPDRDRYAKRIVIGKIILYPSIISIIGLIYLILENSSYPGFGFHDGILFILSGLLFFVLFFKNLSDIIQETEEKYFIYDDHLQFEPLKNLQINIEYDNIEWINIIDENDIRKVFIMSDDFNGLTYPSRFYKNLFQMKVTKPIIPVDIKNKKYKGPHYSIFVLGDTGKIDLRNLIYQKRNEK